MSRIFRVFREADAGELDQLVIIEFNTITIVNEQAVDSWAPWTAAYPLGKTWAKAERRGQTNSHFTIWQKSGILPGLHRFIWDGCIWNVNSAAPSDDRVFTVIDSDFSDKVEVTHLKSTEREFIDGIPIVATPE